MDFKFKDYISIKDFLKKGDPIKEQTFLDEIPYMLIVLEEGWTEEKILDLDVKNFFKLYQDYQERCGFTKEEAIHLERG